MRKADKAGEASGWAKVRAEGPQCSSKEYVQSLIGNMEPLIFSFVL